MTKTTVHRARHRHSPLALLRIARRLLHCTVKKHVNAHRRPPHAAMTPTAQPWLLSQLGDGGMNGVAVGDGVAVVVTVGVGDADGMDDGDGSTTHARLYGNCLSGSVTKSQYVLG